MNINDPSVLEKINCLIASNRLSKNQILQIVNLATISGDIRELKENMNLEELEILYAL